MLRVGHAKTAAGTGRMIPMNDRLRLALRTWACRTPDHLQTHYLFRWSSMGNLARKRRARTMRIPPNRLGAGRPPGRTHGPPPACAVAFTISGTRPVRASSKEVSRRKGHVEVGLRVKVQATVSVRLARWSPDRRQSPADIQAVTTRRACPGIRGFRVRNPQPARRQPQRHGQ